MTFYVYTRQSPHFDYVIVGSIEASNWDEACQRAICHYDPTLESTKEGNFLVTHIPPEKMA